MTGHWEMAEQQDYRYIFKIFQKIIKTNNNK